METDLKLRFDYLHKELVEYQTRFVDMTLKGAGLSLLILGWMLTSESARGFMTSNAKARAAAVGGIVLIEIAYVFIVVRTTQVIHHFAHELHALDYFPPAYYDYRVFPVRIVVASGAISTAPGFVAIVLMLLL